MFLIYCLQSAPPHYSRNSSIFKTQSHSTNYRYTAPLNRACQIINNFYLSYDPLSYIFCKLYYLMVFLCSFNCVIIIIFFFWFNIVFKYNNL